VEKLAPEHLLEKDGQLWIEHSRIKSGVDARVLLLPPAIEILERYSDQVEYSGKLLPVRSNQKYNAYLKEVADFCGIKKRLTTHVARHTFATLMLTYGASIEATANMLGHKNLKQTQHYAKVLRDKLSSEMGTVAENLRKAGLLE
jgi:integrase